jgi:hypothetical protein
MTPVRHTFSNADDLAEHLMGDDPVAMEVYRRAVRRLEYKRRWGALINLTGTAVFSAVIVLFCFAAGAGWFS